MRYETDALVLTGEAQTMPGTLWTLYLSGQRPRTFLLDSMREAAVYAAHFGVGLAFAPPNPVDPRRALDYANIMESMHVPAGGTAVGGAGPDHAQRRYASTVVTGATFDSLSGIDESISGGA